MRDTEIVKKLRAVLKVDEGVRNNPYRDILGHWTVGVGHFLGGNEIGKWEFPAAVVEAFLLEDMKEAHRTLERVFGSLTMSTWDEARYLALMSISFNLGYWKLRDFVKANQCVILGDWQNASKHYLDSHWARQVGGRARRLCFMLETGEIHADYR